jgi:hypothetical protein
MVGEGAAQDTPHNPQPINSANYGRTDFPPPPSCEQSYPYGMRSVVLIIWTQQYTMPVAQQHPYHNVGHVQGVPERQRVIYPVRTNLSSPHIFSTRPFAVGEPRTQWRVLLCSSACYTRPYPGRSSLSTGSPSTHSWPAGIRESPTTRQPLCTTPRFTGYFTLHGTRLRWSM